MKVKVNFYCIESRKRYFKGDDYDGSRKDLSHVLEAPKKKKKQTKK